MDRRDFLSKGTLLAGGLYFIPSQMKAAASAMAANDYLQLGYIGVGKQSLGLLESINAQAGSIVVAASDVDSKKLARFCEKAEKANSKTLGGGKHKVRGYTSYRELLAQDDIDAVVIAAPDHWHAMMAVDAAKAGKDIYCEKPLALTVVEGRAMVEAARKYHVVFQTGNMQRSWHNFRHACEMVRNGYLGEIKTINVSVGDPVIACDLPSEPIPEYLDWDNWVGPSMYRGYNPVLSPPIEDTSWPMWRRYRDFGGGGVTDWGAHMFDIGQWALGMDESGPIRFDPPEEAGAKRGMEMTYMNGTKMRHVEWGENNAVQFLGSEGKIEISRDFYRSDIKGLTKMELKPGEQMLYRSDNHYQDWLDAIRDRKRPVSDVEAGHRTASLCNMVNMGYTLQRSLEWDPINEKIIGDADAQTMLGRPYRGSWNLNDF